MSVPERIIQSSGSITTPAARYLKLGLEKAPNTVRAYRADLNCYTSWCEQYDLIPFPATADQIVNYISELADRYKVSTIQRRLAMLSSFHELQGMESPTGSKLVQTAMDGIKRSLGIRQHQAPAFTLEAFQKVILSLDETLNSQLRDKAVLLLGFTGAFRREELSALNVEDLHFDEEGILIDIRRSKTDQLGAGQVKAIFYASHPALCPVRTLRRYLDRVYPHEPMGEKKTHSGGGRSTVDTGYFSGSTAKAEYHSASQPGRPLLRHMRRGDHFANKRLSGRAVDLIVTKHFGTRFSAHSLRASFVTVSRKNGASTSEIMAQTHHKTEAMIRRYTRFEDARSHNAGTKLGL